MAPTPRYVLEVRFDSMLFEVQVLLIPATRGRAAQVRYNFARVWPIGRTGDVEFDKPLDVDAVTKLWSEGTVDTFLKFCEELHGAAVAREVARQEPARDTAAL